MAVNLSPVGGVAGQFFDNNGNPLSGGKIFTYSAGTTTNQATYTSATGAIAHSNPIILDGAGRVPSGEIWLTDGLEYKFVIKDSNDVLIGTYDNIIGINSNFVNFTNEQEIQTATAGQTVFTLTTMQYAPATNSLSVFVDGVNQYGPGALYAYVETDSTTVTFTAGLHVGAEVKFTTSNLNSSAGGNAFNVSYPPPFVGAVTTNVGDKLAQTVSVKDFGAVGDNVVDDYAAIQAALDYAGTNGSAVWFPPGQYRLTSGLLMPTLRGVELIGTGQGREGVSPLPVELWFYHTGSPAITIRGSAQAIKGMLVRCGGARAAAAYDGISHGILIESADDALSYISDSLIENVDVQGHPGHGILYSGKNFMNKGNGFAVRDCKGHALYISDGTATGRTNKGRPGGFIFDHIRTYKNGGHDIVVTPLPEAEYAYRVFFLDGDLASREGGQPAIPVGLKIADAACIFNGENIHCINLAFAGRVLGTPTYAGMHVSGVTHKYSTCRFVGVVGVASTEVGSLSNTNDISIDEPYVTNDSTISPAVVIGAGVGTITLISRTQNATGVKRIVTPFTAGYKSGIFVNINGIESPQISLSADAEAAALVSRDSNPCGYEVRRTGSGAAIGRVQAVGNTIQYGTVSNNDTVLIRNSIVRATVKSNTINIASLPTSSAGLSAGDLWNDSGTLKVA